MKSHRILINYFECMFQFELNGIFHRIRSRIWNESIISLLRSQFNVNALFVRLKLCAANLVCCGEFRFEIRYGNFRNIHTMQASCKPFYVIPLTTSKQKKLNGPLQLAAVLYTVTKYAIFSQVDYNRASIFKEPMNKMKLQRFKISVYVFGAL